MANILSSRLRQIKDPSWLTRSRLLPQRQVSRHLIGWSWGGAKGGLFTRQHPDQVNRLVLYALALDLLKDFSKATSSPPTFANSPVFPVPTAQFRDNTVNNAAAHSIQRRASRLWLMPTSTRPSRWTRNRRTVSSSAGRPTRSNGSDENRHADACHQRPR